ncbi:DUF6483 family protein [Lachnospiraceae bacterium 54-53]
MVQDDYFTRMISGMVNTLLKLIFQIDHGKNESNAFKDSEMAEKCRELTDLIESGEINEAENRLLEELDPEDMEFYKLALMFYYFLNEKDSGFLEAHDFSKNEVNDGLRYVSRIYGYESMAEALLGKDAQ